MKLSKTNAKKFLTIINKSKKKVFSCEDLSKATGLKLDNIVDYVSIFYPMIYLDNSYNLKLIVDSLENYIKEENKKPKKKIERVSHKEYAKYSSFIDYVYKTMTIGGGILDTGYVLNNKDKKIIRHFLSATGKNKRGK